MKYNKLFNFVEKLSSIFAVFVVLLFASCGNVSIDSGESNVTISLDEKFYADFTARTAVAEVGRDEFLKFTLKCDGEQLGLWQTTNESSAYVKMSTSRLTITNGEHVFILEAEDSSGVKFTDTITQIIEGDTLLNFSLKLALIPTEGVGNVRVTADCSAVKNEARYVSINFYESGDETNYKDSTNLIDPDSYMLRIIPSDGKFTFTALSIPVGQHILEFTFVGVSPANSQQVIGKWTELVTVLPGRESVSEYAVTSVSKFYEINYYIDTGVTTVLHSSNLYYSVYTNYNVIDAPYSSYSKNQNGYDFSGWYLNEEFTGDAVTGWEPFTRTGNVNLYGRFIPKTFTITYKNKDGSDFSATHEEEYPTVHTYGTETVLDVPTIDDENLAFAGWYTGTVDGEGNVTLGSSKYTSLSATGWTDDIVLYAKFATARFYVSSSGSDSAYVDDETAYGDGTEAHPFASVSKAINTISAQNIPLDYKIIVSGELMERVDLTTSNLPAARVNSLLICGKTGNTVDKLNGSANGRVLQARSPVSLILKNICIMNGGPIDYGAGIYIDGNCNVTLDSGALITGNKGFGWSSGGIGVYLKSGTLLMKNGSSVSANNVDASGNVYTNTGDRGGGVFVSRNTTFTMDGGIISGNKIADYDADDGGAGVRVEGTFVMNDGEISGNVMTTTNSGAFGGGGVMVSGGSFTMNGGRITDNSVNNYGGGVYVNTNSTLTMNDGLISSNSATNGDGIYNKGTFIMNGGTISNSNQGVFNFSSFTMTSGSMIDNTVAIYNSSTFRISGDPVIPLKENGDNYVYLVSPVTIAGELTSDSITAYLKPSNYTANNSIITSTYDYPITQTVLEKFVLLPDGNDTFWQLYIESDISAKLSRPRYTISYMNKGGVELLGTLPEDAPAYHLYDTPTSLPVPVRDGYLFNGWYSTPDCSDTVVMTIGGRDLTENIIFYGYWTRETLLFTINQAGLTVTKDDTAEDGSVTITAEDGFSDYSWLITDLDGDYVVPANAISGASVSADGKTLTFNTVNLTRTINYTILVTAKNSNNVQMSASVSVKRPEAD